MKSIIRYFSMIAAVILLAHSCSVDENGILPDDMKEGCFPYFAIDADASDGYIDLNNPDAYELKGTVDVLFDSPFDKLTLVVAFNGAYNNPYIIKDDIVALPLEVNITTADLVSVVAEISSSADIVAGDAFHVYVIPTVDGIALPPYQVLNGRIVNTMSSSLYQNLTAIEGIGNADVSIKVPCAFDNALAAGSFAAVSNDWGAAGDVTVTQDPADPFTVYVDGLFAIEGLEEDKGPLKMVISQRDFSVSVERQPIASSLAPWGLGYTNIGFVGTGTFDTCTGKYTLSLGIFVDQGSFGTFTYTLTHN